MVSALLGFIGGIAAWIATSLIGQPITAFMAARSEDARALARYADWDRYDPESDAPEEKVIADRRKVLADAGSQLVAFSHANQWVTTALRFLKLFPQNAGQQLILLSGLKPLGPNNEDVREQAMKFLRLGKPFGPYHRI